MHFLGFELCSVSTVEAKQHSVLLLLTFWFWCLKEAVLQRCDDSWIILVLEGNVCGSIWQVRHNSSKEGLVHCYGLPAKRQLLYLLSFTPSSSEILLWSSYWSNLLSVWDLNNAGSKWQRWYQVEAWQWNKIRAATLTATGPVLQLNTHLRSEFWAGRKTCDVDERRLNV